MLKGLKCWIWAGALFAAQLAGAQTVCPGVPDFTDITAPWVTTTYGFTEDPFLNEGIVGNRHQVISRQGKDYYTGGVLNFLPAGEDRVVKLGNENWGNEAESITYRFIVDADRPVLFLKFAVVFQDPKHPLVDQPRFVVRIMDKDGNLVESCAEYDVSAREGIEGFQVSRLYNSILWRDWTNVGLDLFSRAGEEVQLQFITYDCKWYGHFGYAYFTASCISRDLALTKCDGREFTVSAPEGFASYLWQDGETTPSVTETQTGEVMDLACEVTSATGCRFTLSAHVTPAPVVPPAPDIYDTICVGDAYTANNYDLPPQTETGTFKFTNSYLNLSDCGNSGTTTLHLTVLPRYYPIEAAICPGEDYTENGFSILQPEPGVHFDTLICSSPTHPCDSVVTLKLTVYQRIGMTKPIEGEKQFCTGTLQEFSIDENWEEGQFVWEFPKGFEIISGQGMKHVLTRVTSEAEAGNINIRYGKAGCAYSSEAFRVEPDMTYLQIWNDTICIGDEYHSNGFDVPKQETPGFHIFSNRYTTRQGCDSIVALNLHVYATPQVRIVSTDSVICDGKKVTLQAWSEKTHFKNPDTSAIAVGDIYCSDGTIVKLENYEKLDGREAVGVIFYVDESGEHGWIVHIAEQGDSLIWAENGLQLPELSWTDGYENTRIIREKSTQKEGGAFFLVDFEEGWYVPSIGQLTVLYGNIPEVNRSLEKANVGELFDLDGNWRYWSSFNDSVAGTWGFYLDNTGVQAGEENVLCSLRAVRSFSTSGSNYGVKIGDFMEDKNGVGIVFWLSSDATYGWMVATEAKELLVPFQGDFPGLPSVENRLEAMQDTAGYGNTALLLQTVGSRSEFALLTEDFQNGWYVPSLGQLRKLLSLGCQLPVELGSDVYVSSTCWREDDFWVTTRWGETKPQRGIVSYFPVRTFRLMEYDTTLSYHWNTGAVTPEVTERPSASAVYEVTVTTSGGVMQRLNIRFLSLLRYQTLSMKRFAGGRSTGVMASRRRRVGNILKHWIIRIVVNKIF